MENTEYSNINEETQLTNSNNNGSSGLSPKWTAVISYVTLVGWVIALVLNSKDKNAFVQFHTRQSLGILALFMASGLIAAVPVLGWIACPVAWLLAVALWFIGIVDALGERTKPVPILGDQFQEWFSGLN